MPVKSVPSYRLHKASGQARVIIDGRHVYLGKFNSPESRQNYARVVAEMSLASPLPEQASLHPPIALLLISEVLVKYLEFAEVYYGANETSSKEFRAMIDAVAPVNEMYGDSSANEFGPLKLKSIRQYMINQDLCRTEINKRIGRIKRVFKWAVSEELVNPSVYEGLRTVAGLQYGRSEARESEPVKPVQEKDVELTLPYVAPQIAAMVRLQLLTGMRPSEVLSMRLEHVDRRDTVWIYQPEKPSTAGLF